MTRHKLKGELQRWTGTRGELYEDPGQDPCPLLHGDGRAAGEMRAEAGLTGASLQGEIAWMPSDSRLLNGVSS